MKQNKPLHDALRAYGEFKNNKDLSKQGDHEMNEALELARDIPPFQLMQWKHALHLEIKGLKNSRRSVYAHVKKQLGLSGTKKKVSEQLDLIVEEIVYG